MSTRRLAGYLIRLGVLVTLGYLVLEYPGTVHMVWQGHVIETTTPVLILGGLVLALPLLFIAGVIRRTLRWAAGNPDLRARQKQDKGHALLAQGLVAVAAGDRALAQRMAKKAHNMLGTSPLLSLLDAQTAWLSGDKAKTEAAYRQLLQEPGMKFLGARGLLNQSLRAKGIRLADGRVNQEALDHARTAFGLEPGSRDVLEILLELEVAAGATDSALRLVPKLQKQGVLSEAAARQKQAAILLAAAETHQQDPAQARRYVLKAAKFAPGFAPAITRAAALCLHQGHKGLARKLLLRGWASHPHPDIARLWLNLEPGQDTLAQMRHIQLLCRGTHLEDHLALAQASLAARLWGETKRHLDEALALGGGMRACKMRAELARLDTHDPLEVQKWLERAADAAPAPIWVSTQTGLTQPEWTPFAQDNGRFDVLQWRVPTIQALAISSAGGY